jgi:hypothetical protein
MVLDSQRPAYERRKLPDPATPRLLALWAGFVVGLLVVHRFFKQKLFTFDGNDWNMTPIGLLSVYVGSILLAIVFAALFYKYKFGKFHLVSILRVVRGILTLFNITVLFFWPISLMIIALNPLQTIYLLFLGLIALVVLSCLVRLGAKPEMGFWRDWLNDALLRW